MEKTHSIIFIGEVIGSHEIRITSKPGIYDIILLTNQSSCASTDMPYQSIPLENQTSISIHLNDISIQLAFHDQSMHIVEASKILTEEEVNSVLSHFMLKEGAWVYLLGQAPYRKSRPRKRKKEGILKEGKELG